MRKIVLAIGGSSGSIYAQRLIKKLSIHSCEVALVMSENAKLNWKLELGELEPDTIPYKTYSNKDFFAPFASGSAKFDTMVICPSSMGLIGRIAQGISSDLITRAADVILKERRKLIVVPRETPYNLIHLRNMTQITEAGGIICPACPTFYTHPTNIDEVVDTVVDRIIDLMGFDHQSKRWGD